ncbi:DNA repair exonuclease SbcCD ATPase subunit [Kitasatospora sp. GAS204A]|uniref:hypothetical protein n=1 Tax=unclassified Kitasatospora TaxID=2633591 RepID=UPI002473B46B|nr:hypothetical protein [Kitasatospora sp. GAS204B]MDH6120819.1 DNA repair exonuclease SbcCD ATPase subunit [Kitasatospora sp. GAS204B]
MEEIRREIRQALDGGGATASLDVLCAALTWACAELRTLEAGPGGTTALAALYALDDALSAGAGLPDVVPGLLDAARAGAGLRQGVRELTDRMAQAGRLLADERDALTELAGREEELRRRLAEHGELRRQVDELRRLERIVAALDGLGEQQEAITARLLQLRGKDAGVEDALRIGAERLLRLSGEQAAVLSPQTRQTLELADRAEAELTAEQQDFDEGAKRLARARERLTELRARRGEQLAALQLHARADAELARALAGAAAAEEPAPAAASGPTVAAERSALAEAEALADYLEARLQRVDAVLRDLLDRREAADAQAHAAVSWATP